MPFCKLKISVKTKSGRGFNDATAAEVIECLVDVWDDFKEALDGLDEADSDSIKDHFNNYIEDEEDLGDIMFGAAEDFQARVKFLDDETQKKYTDEIIDKEVIMIDN